MPESLNYLDSPAFWFGAVVLLASQIAKFYELNSSDPAFSARSSLIPNLRAVDLAGRWAFWTMLFAFLAATLAVYFLLCFILPNVLSGWVHVSGGGGEGAAAAEGVTLDGDGSADTYPLYVAAALMGLTQPIPGWTTIANLQRNVFHYWIGVPRKVIEVAVYFSNQVLGRATTSDGLNSEVAKLLKDGWITHIDDYADTVFYRDQIGRMKLNQDGALEEIQGGSNREKKRVIEDLIYAAAVATVRESGGRGLSQLAEDLDVDTPPPPASPLDAGAGVLLFIVTLTFLWFLIPMLHGVVDMLLGVRPPGTDFWPTTLLFSSQFIFAQGVPMLLAIAIMLQGWSVPHDEADQRHQHHTGRRRAMAMGAFNRYAGRMLAVLVVIVLYDCAQALYDQGYLRKETVEATERESAPGFLGVRMPFFALHSFIAAWACFIVMRFVDRKGYDARWTRIASLGAFLVLVVALVSAFYAEARAFYMYSAPLAFDLVALITLLNVVSALLALAMAILYCRHRVAETQPLEGRLEPASLPNLRTAGS